MRYETVWQKNQEKIEANLRREIAKLNKKTRNQVLEIGLYQNLCFKQNVILQEILAICRQEHMEHLELKDKLERIERYAGRHMAAKR